MHGPRPLPGSARSRGPAPSGVPGGRSGAHTGFPRTGDPGPSLHQPGQGRAHGRSQEPRFGFEPRLRTTPPRVWLSPPGATGNHAQRTVGVPFGIAPAGLSTSQRRPPPLPPEWPAPPRAPRAPHPRQPRRQVGADGQHVLHRLGRRILRGLLRADQDPSPSTSHGVARYGDPKRASRSGYSTPEGPHLAPPRRPHHPMRAPGAACSGPKPHRSPAAPRTSRSAPHTPWDAAAAAPGPPPRPASPHRRGHRPLPSSRPRRRRPPSGPGHPPARTVGAHPRPGKGAKSGLPSPRCDLRSVQDSCFNLPVGMAGAVGRARRRAGAVRPPPGVR